MSWIKKKTKRSIFTSRTPPKVLHGSIHTSTHTVLALTQDYGNLRLYNKNPYGTEGVSTYIYVDLRTLSIARTREEFKPFRYETRHSSISIIAQALDFPTVYINFQPVTESLTPTVKLSAVGHEWNIQPEK